MMAFKHRLAILAAVLALTATGCNARSGPTATSSATTPVVVSTVTAGPTAATSDPACGEVPSTVAGRWQKTITREDLPPELFDADTGVFVMTIGPGHHVRTDVDDDHLGTTEDVCWTAERATWVTDRADCTGDSIGAYEWVVRNDELDFTTIKDDCFWRPFFVTLRTWTRLPS
jgi:hypothetical protein